MPEVKPITLLNLVDYYQRFQSKSGTWPGDEKYVLYTDAVKMQRQAFVAGIDWWGVSYKELKLKQGRAEAARRYREE